MIIEPLHAKNLVETIRKTYPPVHEMGLQFGNCTISVSSDNANLIDELSQYFAPFRQEAENPEICITAHEVRDFVAEDRNGPLAYTVKPPDPGKTKIKEEFKELPDGRMVHKRLTGMLFVFGKGEHLAVGPCLNNTNQVVNFINNRYIEWKLCQGCLLGHAAGVAFNGNGLSIAGFSGAGKSTLALHIMNLGATFISNDRLMVEPDNNGGLLMYGVAKLPRINPGTILNNETLLQILTDGEIQEFSSLPNDALWELEHKYDVPIETCFGPDRFALTGKMDGLVILNWKKDADIPLNIQEVDIETRRDLLPAFMKSTGLFFLPANHCKMPEPDEEAYIWYLSKCRVWEISGKVDFHQAAEKCKALVV